MNTLLTTSMAGEKPHSALEEIVEQIIAITNALEICRERYNQHQQEHQQQLQQQQKVQTSARVTNWSSTSFSSGSAPAAKFSNENYLYALPPGEHPIVLAIWSLSSSEYGYRSSLAKALQDLLVEKRKHMRELELARIAVSKKD